MSKEDLARFKSADAKRLALQRRKAALDRMAADLDAQQAGIMERAERDFSGQSLGASSGQLAQLAANHVPLERYHAGEPEQRAQWSMSVQPALHVAHESHVTGALPDLTGNEHHFWKDCSTCGHKKWKMLTCKSPLK